MFEGIDNLFFLVDIDLVWPIFKVFKDCQLFVSRLLLLFGLRFVDLVRNVPDIEALCSIGDEAVYYGD